MRSQAREADSDKALIFNPTLCHMLEEQGERLGLLMLRKYCLWCIPGGVFG